MKKSLILVFLVLISVPSYSNAQHHPSIRSITAAQLYQYGQAMYHRGDFSQAAVVFGKVLSIDPTHEGAIKYAKQLNNKGQHIAIPKTAEPVAVQVKPKEVIEEKAPVQTKMAKKAVPIPQEKPVVVKADQGDLKADLHQANQDIEQLKGQVAKLRQEIAEVNKPLPIFESNK